jgi:cell division protein FtsZ
MIVIPNEKLLAVAKDAGFFESFRIADDVLRQGVQGISDIIAIPGIINRDFADVKTTMAGMGYAVMGTAVRSGASRAIEAAQAAMASPLLDAGAIDGARGILINITGSSSLKLSEVNEASSLIQSSAHEDANIIFGAVLDEKMGEEVKITVIATGFRDQMPERRARMLTVEEAPVISVPLAYVPLVASGNWLGEPASAPAPPRFLSEDEEDAEKAVELEKLGKLNEPERLDETEKSAFFSAPAPSAEPASVAPASAWPASEVAPRDEAATAFLPEARVQPEKMNEPEEAELEALPARPKFAELSEEPAYMPLPRDYASERMSGARNPAAFDEYRSQTAAAEFFEAGEEAQRDLDTPAFMRRAQF